jgi:hypothetical protein
METISLEIDAELLKKLNARASDEGISLSILANRLLNTALKSQFERPEYKFEFGGWEAVLQPGVNICDRNSLFDVFDSEEGPDSLLTKNESDPIL